MKKWTITPLAVSLFLMLATLSWAQGISYPSCRSDGGQGTTAADSISATLSSPLGATRQMGPLGVYLSSGIPSYYAGFAFFGLGGLVYDGGVSSSGTTSMFVLRHQFEGIFLDDAALPTDCTPSLISGAFVGNPCPKKLVVTDGCGAWSTEYGYRTVGLGGTAIYAPLPYRQQYIGDSLHPGIDAALVPLLTPAYDINGGHQSGGIFSAGAYDSHIPNISVYPWNGPIRPGTEVVIDDITHGIMVGKVGALVRSMRVDYSSGGYQGDPNYKAFSPILRGNLQSYLTVEGMGFQISLGDMGSPVYTFSPDCPQVIGHMVALDSPDNIVTIELDNGAVLPGLIASSNGQIAQLNEAGNSVCRKDNTPTPPMLGENWLPNITMSAYLTGRYKLMDDFLSSKCVYPDGRNCGATTWGDFIASVDSRIQAVGAKDNSDATGTNTQGDVYWNVHLYTTTTVSPNDIYNRILIAVMPGTGKTGYYGSVLGAMVNWGLAIPPIIDPYTLQYDDYIPNVVQGGVGVETVVLAKGRNTSNNLEAQQGNTIVIGGVMFNAQPNPPGTPPAPPALSPTPDGGTIPAGDFNGASPIAPGGDAPNGAPIL